MANLTSAVNVNVDSKIKKEATEILNGLGINMSTAINMFLTQVVMQSGIPFEVKNPKPSRRLRKALKEAEAIASGKKKSKGYRNVEELFEALENEN